LIKFKIIPVLLFLAAAVVNFNGCNYSFTGASVPAHLKTVAIPILEDRSGSGIFKLKEDLTSVLTQKFVEDNSLQVADKANADCIVEGVIVSAVDAASQITAGETISKNKFTINVKVTYRDLVKKTVIFEKTFANYKEYSTAGDIQNARTEAIAEAIKLVSEDILLGVVSNW